MHVNCTINLPQFIYLGYCNAWALQSGEFLKATDHRVTGFSLSFALMLQWSNLYVFSY